MWLGITLGILLFIVAIVATIRTKQKRPVSSFESIMGFLWVFSLFFGVPILCGYDLGLPSPNSAKYEIRIEGQQVLFNTYKETDNQIVIPSHYYEKTSWINSWEYCEDPLVIAIPSANNKLAIGERCIVDRCGTIQALYTAPPKPYIESSLIQSR